MTPERSTRARSHAERRAETTQALLDATIESLLEVGLSGTTTRGVAQRAGISQGAQQHYFPTKGALVDAAISRHLHRVIVDAAQDALDASTGLARADQLFDRMWDVFHDPLYSVVFDLLGRASTHPDAAAKTSATMFSLTEAMIATAADALPEYAAHDDFRDVLLVAIGISRDTAMLARIPGTEGALPNRAAIKQTILRALASLDLQKAGDSTP